MDDPTLRLLSRLEDETQWAINRNVPIFKAHTRTIKDPQTGKVRKIEVTEDDLEAICETYQRLVAETGGFPRLMFGHTIDGAPETEQPIPVGWALNYRVGTFGPARQKCILCDEYVEARYAEARKTYPYRSPEYYAGRQDIASVALLRRDPQLDLGVVMYERDRTDQRDLPSGGPLYYSRGGRAYLYQSEIHMPDMPGETPDPTTPVPGAQTPEDAEREKFDKYVSNHPVLKYVCAKYAAEASTAGQPAPPGGPPAPGPAKMSAAPPGGPPGAGKEPEKMSRAEAALKYERDALNRRVADLERENRVARYRRDLESLQARGVLLDVEEELGECADLGAEAFAKRVEKIAARYSRDITQMPDVPVARDAREIVFTAAHLEKAEQYMRDQTEKTGKSPPWEEAKAFAMKR